MRKHWPRMSTEPNMNRFTVTARRLLLAALGAICALPLAPALQALPDDRDQPIYIQSDMAERDERRGLTIYTGDVEIDQGSLHISAGQVRIRTESDEVSQIIATGEPARMHQQPEPNKEPVYARGNSITYNVEQEILTLVGNASVVQDGTTVKGEKITYFIREQRVKALSGESDSGRQRVQMVIPPRRSGTAADNDAAGKADSSPSETVSDNDSMTGADTPDDNSP